jgi:hypothetical protein
MIILSRISQWMSTLGRLDTSSSRRNSTFRAEIRIHFMLSRDEECIVIGAQGRSSWSSAERVKSTLSSFARLAVT